MTVLADRTSTDGAPPETRRMRRKGVCLVSLGARYVTPTAIQETAAKAASDGVALQFVLLDSLEAVNQRVLHKLSTEAAQDRVTELKLRLVRKIPVGPTPLMLSEVSKLESDDEFQKIHADVRDVYANNRAFASECDAQVFRNLHPRLKRIGVKNKRHPIIGQLSDYMVKELAIKLYLARVEHYDVEYGWSQEMAVWRSLISGKFPEFPPLKEAPPFVVVAANVPRPTRVRFEDVSFNYARVGQAAGIEKLTFDVDGIAAILGPSGSYKTTILKLVAGHLSPMSGQIRIGDVDVTQNPAEQRKVATVFQSYALFPHLTAFENVFEGGRQRTEYSYEERRWLADSLLRRLGVDHCRDRLPAATSGGEQQRVAIARALMAEPQVLLLDEPTAAIDSLQRAALEELLRQIGDLWPSLTILIVSHDRDFVMAVASKVCLVDKGRLVAHGSLSALLERPPNRRTAEILQTHADLGGFLRQDGVFSARGQDDCWIQLPEFPHELGDTDCIALVPHHGVSVQLNANDHPEPGVTSLPCIVTEIVNNGSTLRLRLDLLGSWEVAAVLPKSAELELCAVGSELLAIIDVRSVVIVAE